MIDEGPQPVRSSITVNTAWLLGSRLAVAALGWLGSLLIIRALSPDDYGRFSLIFAVLGLLSIITDMGIGRVAISLIDNTHEHRERLAGSYMVLRAALGLLGYVLGVGFIALGGYGTTTLRAAAVAGIVVILLTIENAHSLVFEVQGRLQLPALAGAIAALVQLASIVIAQRTDPTVITFVVPFVAAAAVASSITVWGANRRMRLRYNVDVRLWRSLLVEAIPISVGSAMTTLYYRLDIVMLSKLSTFDAVAVYSVAYKFVDLVHVIPWAVSLAALPALVAKWPDDTPGFQQIGESVCRVLLLLGGATLVVFVPLADAVIPLLYGQEYESSVTAARILVSSECISFSGAAALLLLIAANRHRNYPWIATGGLVLNAATNLFVIPRFSYLGAASATLLTDITVSLLLWREVRRSGIFQLSGLAHLWQTALAILIAAAFAVVLDLTLPWPVALALAPIGYLSLLHIFRGFGLDGMRGLLKGS